MSKCLKCKKEAPVFGARWCGDCWYPGIDDDYQCFLDMLEEGYTRIQAAVQSGWRGIEEFNKKAKE